MTCTKLDLQLILYSIVAQVQGVLPVGALSVQAAGGAFPSGRN